MPRGLEEKQGGGTGRQATQHASKQPHMSGAPGPPAPPGMTQFHGGYANAYQMPGTAFYGAQGLTGGASRRRQDVSAERRLKTLTIPEDEEILALCELNIKDAEMIGKEAAYNQGPDKKFKPWPLNKRIDTMRDLGVGIIMYLKFHIALALLYVGFGVLALPSLGWYINQSTAPEHAFAGRPDTMGYRFSFGALGRNDYCPANNSRCSEPPYWVIVFEIGIFLMFCGFIFFMRARNKRAAREIDDATNTTRDYSVLAKRLPKELRNPEELLEYFQQWGTVEQISITWDAGDLEVQAKEREMFFRKYVSTRARELKKPNFKPGCCGKPAEYYKDRLKVLQEQFKQTKEEDYKVTGEAFVVYTHELYANDCMVEHNPPLISRLGRLITCKNPADITHARELLHAKRPPHVSDAPEPSDVNWSNLRYGLWNRIIRRLVLGFFSVLIIGGSFAIIFGLERARTDNQNAAESPENPGVLTISVVVAAVVAITNKIMQILMFATTYQEKHHTKTNEGRSLVLKLAVGQFVNSSFIILIVSDFFTRISKSKDFYAENSGAILSIVIFGLLISLVVQALKYLLNNVIFRKIKIKRAMTQTELGEAFLGPEISLAERNAYLLKVFYILMFFGSAFPIIYWFGAVGMILSMYLDKFNLLRVYRQPPAYDDDLAKTSLTAMSIGLAMHYLFGLLNGYYYGQYKFATPYCLTFFILLMMTCFLILILLFPTGLAIFTSKFKRGHSDTGGAPFDRHNRMMPLYCPLQSTGLKIMWLREDTPSERLKTDVHFRQSQRFRDLKNGSAPQQGAVLTHFDPDAIEVFEPEVRTPAAAPALIGNFTSGMPAAGLPAAGPPMGGNVASSAHPPAGAPIPMQQQPPHPQYASPAGQPQGQFVSMPGPPQQQTVPQPQFASMQAPPPTQPQFAPQPQYASGPPQPQFAAGPPQPQFAPGPPQPQYYSPPPGGMPAPQGYAGPPPPSGMPPPQQ